MINATWDAIRVIESHHRTQFNEQYSLLQEQRCAALHALMPMFPQDIRQKIMRCAFRNAGPIEYSADGDGSEYYELKLGPTKYPQPLMLQLYLCQALARSHTHELDCNDPTAADWSNVGTAIDQCIDSMRGHVLEFGGLDYETAHTCVQELIDETYQVFSDTDSVHYAEDMMAPYGVCFQFV